jgi:hypothetical protein
VRAAAMAALAATAGGGGGGWGDDGRVSSRGHQQQQLEVLEVGGVPGTLAPAPGMEVRVSDNGVANPFQ